MVIYLDFDGTVVEHAFPQIGNPNPGCSNVLRKLQAAGHTIILNSVRCNIGGYCLREAFEYLKAASLIEPVTESVPEKIHPPDWDLGKFKSAGHLFIDDVAGKIPLRDTVVIGNSKMVDWEEVDRQLKHSGFY
jgi:hypothetical protein